MTRSAAVTTGEHTRHTALELSKNSWLLALQVPGRDYPSLHPIRGGDTEGLIAKLDAARKRLAKASGQVPKVTLCTEAGYDGFWLVRFLEPRGVDCRVMDPGQLTGQAPGAPGEDRPHRCREYASHADRLVPRRAPCLLHGGDPERRGRGYSPLAS